MYCIIYTSVPSVEIAEQIAKHLVEHRLAACVQVSDKIKSVYRWQNKVQIDDEFLLTIKTTSQRYAAIEKAIQDLHPYDTPEIIQVSIESGAAPYLKWLAEMTQESPN